MSMSILVVDDHEDIRNTVTAELMDAGYKAEARETPLAALTALEQGSWDVIISDLRMPEMDGIQFLKEVKARNSETAVILMTAFGTVKAAVEAMRHGATDFLLKPFEFDQLKIHLERIEERRDLRRDNASLRSALKTSLVQQVVAEAPVMVRLHERVKKAAASNAAVLILGESGTGKECIAHLLHEHSSRANKPFVARNCAAIPETLFESEMFGHTKGSFTGAVKDRKGAFLEAESGTLFLDEIGDLTYGLQAKLLRAIQEQVIRPVGSDRDIPVSPRIVCATNKNLLECCKTHEFREDLYYRLATVTLAVPPLRDRREDIAPLARHFVRLFSGGTRTLAQDAEARLMSYDWPGNVRELRSIIEQSVIFSATNEIQASELSLHSFAPADQPQIDGAPLPLAAVERKYILDVLAKVDGNKTECAKVLQIARSTLMQKLQLYENL